MQIRCQELEKDEYEKYMQTRHKKIVAAEAKLIQKQQNEMHATRKKQEAVMSEKLKIRDHEHNQLLQRYQNVKKELENQQNLERIKLEKQGSRPGTASRSQILNSSRMSARGARGPASKPSYH